ncbi:1207_t:CDS:2, partial [Ambispora gerdemannii]
MDIPFSVLIERAVEPTSSGEDIFANTKPLFEVKKLYLSPSDFILKYPRGAYTSARTVNKRSIMDFNGHIDRIAKSLQLMKFTLPKNNNDKNDVEPSHITQSLADYRDPEKLRKFVLPLLKEGLKEYFQLDSLIEAKEAKVTVFVFYSFEESRPRLIVHISRLNSPKSPKCKVEIYGEPRKLAMAKDSQWVRDRKVIEESLPPGYDEVLLFDSQTQNVYEGLSSNFFVVLPNPDEQQHSMLITAPLKYVLEGTIMKIVVKICERDNIDFRYEFPNIRDIGKWQGALVLPIELLSFRDGSRPTIELPKDNHPIIEHVREE